MEDTQNTLNSGGNAEFFSDLLKRMSSDMNFLGIVSIIYGALSTLTIIGAIVGIPIIFTGIRLRESSEAYKVYADTSDQMTLQRAIERLSRFFFIYKVITICYIAFFVLEIIVIIIIFSLIDFSDLIGNTDFV